MSSVRPREKRVLMVAFHFPPCRGGSGLQRTLAFCRYLPRYGWQPTVLTAEPLAYPERGPDQVDDIPSGLPVRRAFAVDASRHLAVRGRYPRWLSLPDRWVSWFIAALPAGLQLIRRHRPDVLWSTYPIGTAHLIGHALHRLTGIPWVADFRDPMTEVDPATGRPFGDPTVFRVRGWVERLATQHSARMVFVTRGALSMYRERYRALDERKWALIPNGYDEASFAAAGGRLAPDETSSRPTGDRLTLVHSGTLYPTPDRDPRAFFSALSQLLQNRAIRPGELRVVLRATGHDDYYRHLIAEAGIGELVVLAPAIGYREALREMLEADGLLIFQGQDSNPAIPAKLYEYLRARRPIFAMVDPAGDTADILRQLNVGAMAPLVSSEQIGETLTRFLNEIRRGTARVLDLVEAQRFSREATTSALAGLLDSVWAEAVRDLGRTEHVKT